MRKQGFIGIVSSFILTLMLLGIGKEVSATGIFYNLSNAEWNLKTAKKPVSFAYWTNAEYTNESSDDDFTKKSTHFSGNGGFAFAFCPLDSQSLNLQLPRHLRPATNPSLPAYLRFQNLRL